jgi:very-short-patch-repair endonuclease
MKFDFLIMINWTQQDFVKHKELVDKIQNKVNEVGIPFKNPFHGSQLRIFMPDDSIQLKLFCKEARDNIQILQQIAHKLANRLELPLSKSLNEIKMLCNGTERVVNAPSHEGVAVSIGDWGNVEEKLRDIINTGLSFYKTHETFDSTIKPESWGCSVEEDRDTFLKYGDKWYRLFIKKYWVSRKKLRMLCCNKLPKLVQERISILNAIISEHAEKEKILSHNILCKKMYGIQWQDEKSDWSLLNIVLDWVLDLHRQAEKGNIHAGIFKFLEGQHNTDNLLNESKLVSQSLVDFSEKFSKILDFIKMGNGLINCQSQSIENLLILLDSWINNIPQIHDLISFNYLYDEAKNQGIEEIANIATTWDKTGDLLSQSFEWTWYSGILREAYKENLVLAKFDRQNHENNIETFCKLDDVMLEYNRIRISLKHWENIPRYQGSGNLRILQHEFAKKGRHLPIRKIMEQAGDAIQAIKPVFMMSPISVAMYLSPIGPKFDMVIFDEASQVKPADAFCSIIRANQTIVVGDSKQMPPTSFFDKLSRTDDDDEFEEEEINVTQDIESILSLMNSQIPRENHKRTYLRWHYRSKHDSLISPSNRMFYDDKLVIFPTANRKCDELGLKFHHLPNTIYERGRSRTNPEEARIIVEAVSQHIKKYPHLSLGIAAFSLAQQEAILDFLEIKRSMEPEFIDFEKGHPNEPLFVKNLETIQGDERDVIFISVGYGKDENGFVSMSFGPVNMEGGERRLNVIMTRARCRCEIFSNITAEDIRLSETPGEGVKALKSYLYFANTGGFEYPRPSGQLPMSPFEEEVIDRLTRHGYKVVPQVGSSGFFIDIGVCDPENSDKFILGIECDGAKYHSAKSARDRDRLRQEVLENRGWNIYRIWGTDWWRNQEQEFKRLIEAINRAIACKGENGKKTKIEPKLIIEKIQNVVPETSELAKPYKVANSEIDLRGKKIGKIGYDKIAQWVKEVVWVESPIHIEELVLRVRELSGLGRTGDVIRKAIDRGVTFGEMIKVVSVENDFVWKLPRHEPEIRNRSSLPNCSRKIEYIHVKEIQLAIMKIVEISFGITKDEAITNVLNLFGFDRTTDSMRDYVNNQIVELIKTQKLEYDEKQLKTGIQTNK